MLYGIIYEDKLGFLYCNISELLFQHRYQTRNKMLKVPKIHGEVVRFNFLYRSIIEFNNLSKTIKDAANASTFSQVLKSFFRSNQ